MRVTMLVDNIAADAGMRAEHGLSLYIETAGHRILFDTGQSDAFLRNAEALDIDLATVDMAIISHGHYDHTRGLPHFFALNDHAPVYLQRRAFERHGASDGRNIGMEPALLESGRFIFTDDDLSLGEGLTLCTCNSKARPFDSNSNGLFMFHDGQPVQDDFEHEQYLCIDEGNRRVVISGCSHKGILNIMHWLHPDVLIGGFHFMGVELSESGKDILDRAAEELTTYKTDYYTGHCTGKKQFDWLKSRMGERLHYFAGGMTLEF
ncbi:MAG: MBL fold metallo-hydrolase [Mailhella sp.]|nr:MBL fold metallo-hydrolase [Mailhella sp.]